MIIYIIATIVLLIAVIFLFSLIGVLTGVLCKRGRYALAKYLLLVCSSAILAWSFYGAYNCGFNAMGKERCYESLAKELKRPDLCDNIVGQDLWERRSCIVDAYDLQANLEDKTASELHSEGLKFYNYKVYRYALALWLKEAELSPRNANTLNNIGIAYRQLEKYGDAVEYHAKALELKPDFGKAHYNHGLALYYHKDYKEAIEAYLKAIELNYKIADAFFNIGLAHENLSNLKEAIEAYSRVVELNGAKTSSAKENILKITKELKN